MDSLICCAKQLSRFSLLLASLVLVNHAICQQDFGVVYGPYNAVILPDGPGVSLPMEDGKAGTRPSYPPIPAEILQAHAQWTLTFWFHASDPFPSSGTTILAGLGNLSASDARFIAVHDRHLALWLGETQIIPGEAELNTAEWHFAAAVFENDKVLLYSDGRQVVVSTITPTQIDAHLLVAPAAITGADRHFGGKIADLRIYSGPLAEAQIATLAAEPPDFALGQCIAASRSWPVQTRSMAGQLEPQDPLTLPHGRSPIPKPIAKAISRADLRTRLVGNNPWKITGGWKVAAAPTVKDPGATISHVGFPTGNWLVATVPGTALTTLIDRGIYPESDYGLNNLAIPETLAHQAYWYRVEFTPPQISPGKHLVLTFEGVNYAADVWLNGKSLGNFTGAFLRGKFDITSIVRKGAANALAVLVSPPPHPGLAQEESIKAGPGENGGMEMLDGPTFGATEGWDWIPSIRDRNTGIWQDVTLTAEGAITVGDSNVITVLPNSDLSEADIEIEIPLANRTAIAGHGELLASFDDVTVRKHITLKPGETIIRLSAAEFPQLRIWKPKLWWPNGYGDPVLHHLKVVVKNDREVSSSREIDFGMREVSYELSLLDAMGHLRRVEVLPSRTHDFALSLINETHEGIRQIDDKTPNQLPPGESLPEWLKHTWVHSLMPEAEGSPSIRPVADAWLGTDLVIKINGVRIAARGGNWGMDDSRKRVSLERLEPYFRLHRDAHVNMIRNWMGQNSEENFYKLADKYGLMVWNDFWESTQSYNLEAQDPELFLRNAKDTILRFRHHPSIVVWCGRNEGVPQPIINEGLATLVRTLDHTRYYTGSSNVINLRNSGPYQLEPLETYYRINRGFSVELGIPSVPTLDAIESFIPEADRWPISDTWAYHDWHQQGSGNVKPFMEYMERAFGAPTSLQDFERKAQMIDYAAYRAIFEGFNAHLWQPNSARLIWMTQPAWPSMEWNFLGSDYDTQSSFYGTQKACEPLHVQLNLDDGSIDVINLGQARPLRVRARVVSLNGRNLLDDTVAIQALSNARTPVRNLDLKTVSAGHAVLVVLQLMDSDSMPITDNFYWWSQADSSLRELNDLPPAELNVSANWNSDQDTVEVALHNTGTVPALLLKVTLKDVASGKRILPAYYSENYVSLLPGEERTITINFSRANQQTSVELRGWNLQPLTRKLPTVPSRSVGISVSRAFVAANRGAVATK